MIYFEEAEATDWLEVLEGNFSDLENENYMRTVDVSVSRQALSAYQAVCLLNFGILTARADGYHQPCAGILLEDCEENETAYYVVEGFVENPAWSWTPGATLYLSDSVYGELTETPPSNNKQVVGFAWDETTVFVQGNVFIQDYVGSTSSTTTTTTTTTTVTTISTTTTTT